MIEDEGGGDWRGDQKSEGLGGESFCALQIMTILGKPRTIGGISS